MSEEKYYIGWRPATPSGAMVQDVDAYYLFGKTTEEWARAWAREGVTRKDIYLAEYDTDDDYGEEIRRIKSRGVEYIFIHR